MSESLGSFIPDEDVKAPDDIIDAAEEIAPEYGDIVEPDGTINVGRIDEKLEGEALEKGAEEDELRRKKEAEAALRRAKAEIIREGHGSTEISLLDYLLVRSDMDPTGSNASILARMVTSRMPDPDDIRALAYALKTTYLEEERAKQQILAEEFNKTWDDGDKAWHRGSDNQSRIARNKANEQYKRVQELEIKVPRLALVLDEAADLVEKNGPDI